MSKKQNLYAQFFAKNKMVESIDLETGISDATLTEVWSQNSNEGSGFTLKLKCINSTKSGSQIFCGSFMIPVTTYKCIVMFAERKVQILLAKLNLLPERKSLNVKVLLNKSLKHEKRFNMRYGISVKTGSFIQNVGINKN